MSREALLARTMVDLADNLVDKFDVVELLTLLTDRCAEVLNVSAAGLMLAAPEGDLRVVAASSESMRMVEIFELQADEGPCSDCFRTGVAVINQELNALGGRWPNFGPVAMKAGYQSVHAVPMRLRGEVIGALNLFKTDEGRLEPDDVLVAQALADIATIAILQHRAASEAYRVTEQLHHALTSRILIEQAKGMLSQQSGLDMEQAFEWLRKHARNHNLLLIEVAKAVIDGTLVPDPPRVSRSV